MSSLRPLLVIGTRPEAIKMSPIARACAARAPEIEPIVCLTGQHREMVRPVLDYFEVPVDVDLQVFSAGQSLAALTARCLEGLDAAIRRFQPDCVVAQGDTTTVMAASLAAFYLRVPLVHVEAGLRTHDLTSPWPEELNRQIVTLSAALHCAPTEQAAKNLVASGIDSRSIHITGNTIVDALNWTRRREQRREKYWNDRYALSDDEKVVVITSHRRENFATGLDGICAAVARLAALFPQIRFVFPVHPNPQVQRQVKGRLGNISNVHLREPLSYPEFVWLLSRAAAVLTDSGGVQEECACLGKPVLVMRDVTERSEALASKRSTLVGTSADNIVAAAKRLLDGSAKMRWTDDTNIFGDGHAAERIADLMVQRFARTADKAVRASHSTLAA